jgi:hypothetical protein
VLGCDVFVDPAAMLLQGIALDAQGAWRLPGVPLPALPALRGLQLVLQAVCVESGQLAFTNGVLGVLGD